MRIGVVLAGGESSNQLVPPVVRSACNGPGALVVAADSGLDLAEQLGIEPTLVVGDFDSVSEAALTRARERVAEIVEHPVAKDETDLELALDEVIARGADRIVVVGGAGGRLDHLLANVAAVAGVPAGIVAEAWFDRQLVAVV